MALRRVRATARAGFAGFEEATSRLLRRNRTPGALEERDLQRLRSRIEACLDPRLSGVAIRNRAAEVAEIVAGLDSDGLLAFFGLLRQSFGPHAEDLAGLIEQLTPTPLARSGAGGSGAASIATDTPRGDPTSIPSSPTEPADAAPVAETADTADMAQA